VPLREKTRIDGDQNMPDPFHTAEEAPLNLDTVRDELGRVPIIGPCTDRELFLDLPASGLVHQRISENSSRVDREFLANDFAYGI
jgi:hypothetical protein